MPDDGELASFPLVLGKVFCGRMNLRGLGHILQWNLFLCWKQFLHISRIIRVIDLTRIFPKMFRHSDSAFWVLTSLVVRGKEAFGGKDMKQKRKDELSTDSSGCHRRDAWELFSTTLKQKRVLKKMGEGFRLAASQRDFSFGFCHSTSSPSRPDSDNGNQFTNSPYKWFV